MTQAQIVDGVVHWLATDLQAAAYPPGIVQFVSVTPDIGVAEGWLYSAAGIFSPPPPAPVPLPSPVPLTPIQFVGLLETIGGMTDAQIAAFAVDPAPAIVAIRFKIGLVSHLLPSDSALATGLAALQAANYLTPAAAAAVVSMWPTSPPPP